MTVFGTTLDPAAIASLVGLVASLVFWLFVLRGEKDSLTRFRRWEGDRKARRDAELAKARGEVSGPDVSPDPKRGPWG